MFIFTLHDLFLYIKRKGLPCSINEPGATPLPVLGFIFKPKSVLLHHSITERNYANIDRLSWDASLRLVAMAGSILDPVLSWLMAVLFLF